MATYSSGGDSTGGGLKVAQWAGDSKITRHQGKTAEAEVFRGLGSD